MKLVCFDLDGTIVDSQRAIVGCFQHALRVHGCDPVDDAVIAGRIGLPLSQMLLELAPPDRIEACIATYKADFHAWDRRLTVPFEGMIEAIRRTRELGFRTAVTSSKARVGIVRVVADHGMEDLFDALWGGDQVSRGKPHPEMLERAMEGFGVGPERTMLVGDTSFDVEMGVAAGVHTLGVAWGMHGPERLTECGAHAVVGSAAELLDRIAAR